MMSWRLKGRPVSQAQVGGDDKKKKKRALWRNFHVSWIRRPFADRTQTGTIQKRSSKETHCNLAKMARQRWYTSSTKKLEKQPGEESGKRGAAKKKKVPSSIRLGLSIGRQGKRRKETKKEEVLTWLRQKPDKKGTESWTGKGRHENLGKKKRGGR